MMTVSERLRKLRENEKLTQTQLAKEFHMTQQSLSSLEKGETGFSDEYIVQFAKRFNVSADYLLGLSNAPTVDKDLQFVCDYTGLSAENVEDLHFYNKILEDEALLKSINYLLNNFLLRGALHRDITDLIENTTALYLIYEERFNRDNDDFLKAIESDSDEIIFKLKKQTLEENNNVKDFRLKISGLKYSISQSFSNYIDKFALSNIDGINTEDFYEMEAQFYRKGFHGDENRKCRM